MLSRFSSLRRVASTTFISRPTSRFLSSKFDEFNHPSSDLEHSSGLLLYHRPQAMTARVLTSVSFVNLYVSEGISIEKELILDFYLLFCHTL